MFTLIENGEIYTPGFIGRQSILLAKNLILKVGKISRSAVEQVGVEVDIIDATDCIVTPGFIDPHQHLLGGSGEKGFASQTPEISASEIAAGGVTTVVGCLGADTTMKTMPGLLAKVKGLKEEGLNAYMWSGGYNLPPTATTSSVRDDVMFIEEVIGAGEVAISDERSSAPTVQELARLIHQVHVGGLLSKKAGITHVHIGEQEGGLKLLRDVVEKHNVSPEWIYATHISRSEKLMLEAIEFAKDGGYVDIDTADDTLGDCLKFYMSHTGWEEKLTISSDASITSPQNLFTQFRKCVLEHDLSVETMLPFVTTNTARALRLEVKGRLEEGKASDALVLTKDGLEIREVISLGRRLVKEGKLAFSEKFLEESNREIVLIGQNADGNGKGDLATSYAERHAVAPVASYVGGDGRG
jgi:beta-aspartyl-dipeptidase (metallo-type)